VPIRMPDAATIRVTSPVMSCISECPLVVMEICC